MRCRLKRPTGRVVSCQSMALELRSRVQRLHFYSFDESTQQMQGSVLIDSHRSAQDDINASQARMHDETDREEERKTEPVAGCCRRHADRASDGEAMECVCGVFWHGSTSNQSCKHALHQDVNTSINIPKSFVLPNRLSVVCLAKFPENHFVRSVGIFMDGGRLWMKRNIRVGAVHWYDTSLPVQADFG
jgi:hypothetical protein